MLANSKPCYCVKGTRTQSSLVRISLSNAQASFKAPTQPYGRRTDRRLRSDHQLDPNQFGRGIENGRLNPHESLDLRPGWNVGRFRLRARPRLANSLGRKSGCRCAIFAELAVDAPRPLIQRAMPVAMPPFSLEPASTDDAPQLAALHNAVAEHLTRTHGKGPWSSQSAEKGVLYALRTNRVFVARDGAEIVGALSLTTKKPWAIDTSYFTRCRKPLYLLAMAINPLKRQGIGRTCLDWPSRSKAWPADAIRLDAFDAEAGAGPFYARCGWTEVGRVVYRKVPLIY